MPVRPPHCLATRSDASFDVLQHELLAEKAASLGRAGKKVEAAMAALRADDGADPDARAARVRAAAAAVFGYVVQREACGMADHDAALDLYGVPHEVKARIGAG